MSDTDLIVRTMSLGELDLAITWAAAEGWNPGLHDADCFHATDPGGFFLGLLAGEPIGCISTVSYGAAFAFLGFYIVKPEFRGRGFGLKIWQTSIAHLGDRNIGLDGVVAQQDNYRKSGFELAYRTIRHEGAWDGSEPAGIVDLTTLKFEQVLAYDRLLFPAPRARFLRSWLRLPESSALGVVQEGQLVGYGVIRACQSGFRIGPLFADSAEVAETLFQGLCARAQGAPVFLDIPEVNACALALAERHALKPMSETARMYTRSAPNIDLARIYGVTSLELG